MTSVLTRPIDYFTCSNFNGVSLLPPLYFRRCVSSSCISSAMKLHMRARPCRSASYGKHVRRVPHARKILGCGMAPKFLPRFLKRKSHTTPESSSPRPPDGDDESERTITEDEPQPVDANSQMAHTAANVLVFSLRTLSGISNSIPVVGALSGIIDTLLGIVGQIQQTSANEQSLAQLAARIERLTPIVTQMAKDDPLKGQGIVEELRRSANRLC
ncbi:hypothetical protein C8R45DRAFT_448965 [Mycena sanguinolenta]|nr:hypothetical protein C8R45DRAFT_448965 [Mycena sanguinolenta]